ncbi:streptomycin 6-kinase [Kribbella antiqua]|uniref:Streptomycin 6-kinase n=1 Tax=Kribbella antiqua TaxID=2512217 RepID=A0A4R2IKF7_9ACTN|nr:aminoglycoside phosphotransferase family protein [Kribbella antiqua]TCO44348.1 streptomycin 6-kinase [Kribbella antiqua]
MIPEAFTRSTIEREGEAGATWLAELPGIVAELMERWGCKPDGPVVHGRVGVVVPVQDAVIKVSFPHPGNVHEPDAFTAWDGQGAVRLYERDDERFAMLLERVHPSTLAELGAGDEIAAVAGSLSRRLSIPAPPELPRLADQADSWEDELRRGAADFPDALPAAVVEAALAVVDELGRSQPDLLLHGDFHPRNILRAEREPWLAVDPKGYVGDPAYDGGTLLKPRALALIDSADLTKALQRELDVFAEAAELDRERVRRWAHLQLVQAAFHGRRYGFGRARSGPLLDRIIALADQLAVSWC